MKVYVVGESLGYARWIDNCELVDDIEEAQVVFFTGGGDVSPKYYGCKQHPATWPSVYRDEEEIRMFQKVRPNQVVFGTCRGLQLVCVTNGGLLIQDVTSHAGCDHNITNGKETYRVTSLHHQMIYPWVLDPKDYDILFWSSTKRSKHYEGDKIDPEKVKVEPEVVIFHKEGMPFCFGVQGHPEMMSKKDPFVRKLNEMLLGYVEDICR
jgi:gamma-glutamyl-gamma-aminobutyrate hydrolase PuuD